MEECAFPSSRGSEHCKLQSSFYPDGNLFIWSSGWSRGSSLQTWLIVRPNFLTSSASIQVTAGGLSKLWGKSGREGRMSQPSVDGVVGWFVSFYSRLDGVFYLRVRQTDFARPICHKKKKKERLLLLPFFSLVFLPFQSRDKTATTELMK